jgi:hypothetical protein
MMSLAEIAADLVIHLVDGLELVPETAHGIVERHIDAVVVVAAVIWRRE